MKTVGELKQYLEEQQLSPEQLAPKVKLSNMTIRRLLERPSHSVIPEKYQAQFESIRLTVLTNEQDVVGFLSEKGENVSKDETARIKENVNEHAEKLKVDLSFRQKLKELASHALSSKNLKAKAIAIGALLYFLNPIDLIPDFSGPLGLVDDLGVITLALSAINKIGKKNQ